VNDQREAEIPLAGGTANRGRIVRTGDTVRRPLRPTSSATHALLRHLEQVGFDGAPAFLGIDDAGREVLEYMRGTAPMSPYPDWALSDDALVSLAVLLRRFHDATMGFAPLELTWERPVPAAFRTAQISHNDPNLDNVVFRDGVAVALIDFDLAGPGSRTWDLAQAARLWCPLRSEVDVPDLRQGRGTARLRIFLEAYQADAGQRSALVEAVLLSHTWAYDHVAREVARGHAAFAEHWVAGQARDRAARTWQWLLEHRAELAAAVDQPT
jgi:hypothetical protein